MKVVEEFKLQSAINKRSSPKQSNRLKNLILGSKSTKRIYEAIITEGILSKEIENFPLLFKYLIKKILNILTDKELIGGITQSISGFNFKNKFSYLKINFNDVIEILEQNESKEYKTSESTKKEIKIIFPS